MADAGSRSVWRWAIFGVYVALLTVVLLVPNPWAWLNWLRADDTPTPPRLPHWLTDKAQHLICFGLLGGLMMWAAQRRGRRPAAACFAAAVAYGAVTEWLQGYFPPRATDFNDLIADSAGALVGVAVAVVLVRPCVVMPPVSELSPETDRLSPQ